MPLQRNEIVRYTQEAWPGLWQAAAEKAAQTPILAGSHRGLAANQVGALGELALEAWLSKRGVPFQDQTRCTTHDYVLGTDLRVDIKTKDRTVQPSVDFDCSVPLYNHAHQIPDIFVFASIHGPKRHPMYGSDNIARYTEVFLLGWISYPDLETKGHTWNAGDTDPANGTKFWTACKNIRIAELAPMHALLGRIGDAS